MAVLAIVAAHGMLMHPRDSRCMSLCAAVWPMFVTNVGIGKRI